MSEFKYKSDGFDKASQRFVIPIYIKDELGDYNYSSTCTLLKYKNSHYIVFAAHALDGGVDIKNVAVLGMDGEFMHLVDLAIGYRVFDKEDLVFVDCFNSKMDGKNYFSLLNEFSLVGFDKNHFIWTGFPQGWCKTKVIHRSKNSDSIVRENVIVNDDGNYFKNARYFSILSKVKSFNKIEITGNYKAKKAALKYAGKVSNGPSPQGMSGGAMYFFTKDQILKEDIDSTFILAGIGLSFIKDGTITGISRYKVIELLEQFENESPLVINLRMSPPWL